MLSCHRSVIIRSLGLLGLVVLMVMVTDSAAWAAYIQSTATTAPETFPYLSPDLTQRNMLLNAFGFQMNLFGAINGTVKDLSALNYLALTGCLIGALLTIFNAKYRKAPIIASWLLLVVITVFAPYGSRLLFYPVSTEAVKGGGILPQGTVANCEGANALRCGFTPQLVAIHVASTLQLTFSDVFRSMGWNGLMERIQADTALSESENLVIPENIYRQAIPNYNKDCGSLGFDNLVKAYTGQSTPAGGTAGGTAPVAPATASKVMPKWNLGKAMDELRKFYNEGDVTQKTAPPIITLFGDDEFKKHMTDEKWDPSVQGMYEAGIDYLHSMYAAAGGPSVKVGCTDTSCITVDNALKEMDTNNFFNTTDGDKLMPGFIFSWEDAKNLGAYGLSPGDMRKCYRVKESQISTDSTTNGGGAGELQHVCETGDGKAGKITWQREAQKEAFNKIAAGDLQALTGTGWDSLMALFNPSQNTSLMNMPVFVANYDLGKGSVYTPAAPVQRTAETVVQCIPDGKKLIDDIIDSTMSESGKSSMLDNLPKLLKGTASPKDGWDNIGWSDITSKTEGQEGPLFDGLVNNLVIALNGRISDDTDIKNAPLTAQESQASVLNAFLSYVDKSSTLGISGRRLGEEVQAANDGQTPDVVGNRAFTWLGGGLAKFLGGWLVKIGSWFVGPVSAALIYFLSMLIDLAMLALIVLTPFLFMAGLFVPTMAIGVLSVTVLGAFILKFVPVTLIILNNLGMMIYNFIHVGADPDKASIMQAMIIIAMAGLYANLVGMTFFLLFKLGDPAAILGRFTGLDSAAKQIADQGVAAAIGVATIAAGLAAGGLYGLAGNTLAGRGAKLAADKLGGTGMINKAKALTGDGATKAGQEGLVDQDGKPLDPAGKLNDEQMAGMASAMDAFGIESDDAKKLVETGELEKDGAKFKFDKETGLVTRNGFGIAGAGDAIPNIAKMQQAMVREFGDPNENPSLPKPPAGPEGSAPPIPGGPSAPQLPGGSGAAAAYGGGVAQQVSVVGGTLGSVGEIGKVQALGSDSDVNKRVADAQAEIKAKEIANTASDMQDVTKNGKFSPEDKKVLDEAMNDYVNAKDDPSREEALDKFDSKLDDIGVSRAMAKQGLLTRRNLEDDLIVQTQGQIGKIDNRISSLDKQIAEETNEARKTSFVSQRDKLKKERDDLARLNPVAMTEAKMLSTLGSMKEMEAAMNTLGAADYRPSNLQAFMSGIYGAASGASGGLARIPIIGSAISETVNEFYQAPERARAVNAAGGFQKWWTAQGDAQRMGFYSKEMAPLGAAQQYQTMASVGAFQAQADITRQTATEAVMRSRSQYEAMVVNSLNNRKNDGISVDSVNFTNYMSGTDLAGLGRQEAADRIASVRQEAALMQKSPLKVERAYIADSKGNYIYENGERVDALDNNMRLKALKEGQQVKVDKDEAVALTPQALAWLRGNLTTKRIATGFDDMMIAHYGLTEKQYMRGNVDWDRSRNMNTDKEAAANFARQDVSTDYLVGGHLKMVEGKIRFKDSQGQYQKLVEFRNDEGRAKLEYLQTEIAQKGYNNVLQAAKFDEASFKGTASELANARREALDKYARDESKKVGKLLKMEAIFDEAAANGLMKYEEKAFIAPFRDATRNSTLYEKISKEAIRQLESVKGLDPKTFSGSQILNGTSRGSLDKGMQVITDKLMAQIGNEDLGPAIKTYAEALQNAGGGVKTFTVDANVDIGGIKQDVAYTAVGLTKEGYDNIQKSFSGNRDMLAKVNKTFVREIDDTGNEFYRVSNLAINNSGQQFRDVQIRDFVKLPPRKTKDREDTTGQTD